MDWLLQYTDPSIDWGYAMSTLVVRFLGVFVVLGIVQAAIQVASRVIGAIEGQAAKSSANAVVKTAATAGVSTTAHAATGAADVSTAAHAATGAADVSAAARAEAGAADRSNVSARTGAAAATADDSATVDAGIGIDDATAAAIGLALALEAGEEGATIPRIVPASGSSSAWAMAGRLRNLR